MGLSVSRNRDQSVEQKSSIFARWWKRLTVSRCLKSTSSTRAPNLDDPALFPGLKPDSDLYGLPQRTVCQRRGWYHIHRRERTCKICSSATFLQRSPSLFPVCLPSEVIHRIVEMLLIQAQGYPRSMEATNAALVCKHWAKVCLRPDKERVDKLRGRAHVMALRSLVCVPGSYLKHSVVKINTMFYSLDKKDDSDPWLHLVPELRGLLANYTKSDWVSISGPLCNGLKTMRSIHAYLPRTLPPAFSRAIETLFLQNITFLHFRDLQHLLVELPELEKFHGLELSWSTAPANTPALPRLPHHRRITGTKSMQAFLGKSTRNVEAITLCAAFHSHLYIALRSVCESLVLHKEECTVKTAWKVINNEACLSKTGAPPADTRAILYNIYVRSELNYTYRDSEFELRILFPFTSHPRSRLPEANARHSAIVVLWSDMTPRHIASIDWKALDEALSTHFDVECMVCGHASPLFFHERDWTALREDEQQFVVDSLPVVASAGPGRLSFARPPPREMVWNEDEAWPL